MGTLVLRIVAVLMILVGSGGIGVSLMVFGEVSGELNKIDDTVQSVVATVKVASDGVDAASSSLGEGLASVVALLDNTAKGLGETVTVVNDSVKTVDNVGKQVPTVIHTTANTIEGAAISLATTRRDLAGLGDQIGTSLGTTTKDIAKINTQISASLRNTSRDLAGIGDQIGELQTSLEIAQLQAQLAATKTDLQVIQNDALVFTGQDLIANAPWLSGTLGVPQSVLEDEGRRLIAEGQTFRLQADSLKFSAKELEGLAQLAVNIPTLDAAVIQAEADAAAAAGTVWALNVALPIAELDSISSGLDQADVVFDELKTAVAGSSREINALSGQVSTAVSNTEKGIADLNAQLQSLVASSGDEIRVLRENLGWNATTMRRSIDDVQGVTNQAAQFLDVTGKQLVTVNTSLQDVSKELNNFKGVGQQQLADVNTSLRATADVMGGVSLGALGGDVVNGLKTFMIMTNVLFVMAGVGLFSITMLPGIRGVAASKVA